MATIERMIILMLFFYFFFVLLLSLIFFFLRVYIYNIMYSIIYILYVVYCHGPKAFPVVTSVDRSAGLTRKKKNNNNTQTISTNTRIHCILYAHAHTHALAAHTKHTRTHTLRFVPTVFAARRRLPVVSLSIGPKRVYTCIYIYIILYTYTSILYAIPPSTTRCAHTR